jgi:uncharacterized phage-associated protein
MAAKKRTIRRRKVAAQRIKPNEDKFRELLLFIARRSEGDPRFGAIKLNKLLFYSDFLAYLMLGQPITGQEYFALAQGPAPRYLVRVRDQMKAKGDIAIRRKENYSGVHERVLALREPDLSKFTPQEVDLVTRILQNCWGRTGSELTEATHRFAGWRLAADKETIPYSVALVGNRLPTSDEIKFGVKLEAIAASCLAENAAGLG